MKHIVGFSQSYCIVFGCSFSAFVIHVPWLVYMITTCTYIVEYTLSLKTCTKQTSFLDRTGDNCCRQVQGKTQVIILAPSNSTIINYSQSWLIYQFTKTECHRVPQTRNFTLVQSSSAQLKPIRDAMSRSMLIFWYVPFHGVAVSLITDA